MPHAANLPSVREIRALADEFGIEMSDSEAQSYQNCMQGPIASYRRLEEFPEFRPPVKYPRDPGYRPAAKDNPFNAWYWRCHIEGASSGDLKGFDVGIKDPICVAGVPLINGSRILEGFIPDIDATVVTRVLDAGGTIVGKTNTEDCSFSGGGHTCVAGPMRNPHKPTHSPGRIIGRQRRRRRGGRRRRWRSEVIRQAPSACRRRAAAWSVISRLSDSFLIPASS